LKRDKEFNNILDECLERLLGQGETLEQCLEGFPEYADMLKPLLETALATKKASAIQPHPEFRDKARQQFYSVLQEIEQKRSRSFFSWSWRPQRAAAIAIAIALVLLLGGGGTAAAANNSMPDEFLYPVKIATEQVRLAFTFSDIGKAELYANLADKRVAEIDYVVNKGKPESVEPPAKWLKKYLPEMVSLTSTEEVTVEAVAAPPTFERAELEAEQAETFTAPSASDRAASQPEQAKAGKKQPVESNRQASLKRTIIQHASNHPARLDALLPKVPEPVRLILEETITTFETDYQKIIDSLDQPQQNKNKLGKGGR